MRYIGVDPGKAGGFAVLNEVGNLIAYRATFVSGDELDLSGIANWLWNIIKTDPEVSIMPIAYIENVHAMPGQGVSSMFSFGFSTGAVHGILAAFEISRYLVTPQAWKKVILAGTAKDKDAAVAYCRRAFPTCDLLATPRSKKPHDGIADAICIAQYGYLKHETRG
jgi:crossover junction endodeoxyribonuclease RuvC